MNIRKTAVLLCACCLALSIAPAWGLTPEQRREYRRKLLETLPQVPAFTQWVEKTDELPPDFDAFPRQNDLPDPLRFLNGKPVSTTKDWRQRRAEIMNLFEKYDVGTFPPKPKLDGVTLLDEKAGPGYLIRNVRLEFGPQGKGTMRVQVMIPSGSGPFPVLISPNLPGWGPSLLRRGYISCGYAGNDRMDDAAPLAELYPDYDFALLPRRAWAAQLVVDYLESLPQVDKSRIALFGYSRDGKMATIAAALDERISALIAGSTGVGGILPWRLSGEKNAGEGIESTTRMFPTWFVPRLRFFAGREDRLPIDGNLLVALLAPRPILMEYGFNDEVSNSWGSEQSYASALKVYSMLGHPERISIFRVPGFHGANDQEACMDWLDFQFKRSTRPWTNDFLFPWNFDSWRSETGEKVDLARYPKRSGSDFLSKPGGGTISSSAEWESKAASVKQSVRWMLGEEPPQFSPEDAAVARGPVRPPRASGNPGQTTPDLVAWVIGRGGNDFGWLEPQKSATKSRPVNFGFNVKGDLYYPANTPPGKKLPAVIWLHPFSYQLGYMWVYHNDLHPILALVQAGYAVLAYDQSGFGSRMGETAPFYHRYPHWSQMGRYVEDARAGVELLGKDSSIDASRIYLFGYSLGGTVALYTASLDDRVKGLVSISGYTPMRTDTMESGTGGLARYSRLRGTIPRLGFFIGHEDQVPYDFDDVIGSIAPRPVLVVQPQLDRDAHTEDVHASVQRARQVYALYGAEPKLGIEEPWDYNRLPTVTQDKVISWVKENCP